MRRPSAAGQSASLTSRERSAPSRDPAGRRARRRQNEHGADLSASPWASHVKNHDMPMLSMNVGAVCTRQVVVPRGTDTVLLALDDLIEFFAGRLGGLATVVAREQRMERDARP